MLYNFLIIKNIIIQIYIWTLRFYKIQNNNQKGFIFFKNNILLQKRLLDQLNELEELKNELEP